MKLNFAIDYMNVLEADDDTAIVELDLLHVGKNRNGYDITKEAIEAAIPTFYNKPIIYRLNNEFLPDMATDVLEHGTVEDRQMRIAGIIPESAPMEFVERNGKEYLRTKGIIYKIYQPALMNILTNRDGNMKVSIEIIVRDKDSDDEGYWIVNDFKFEGVALLGELVQEGIEGSQLNVIKFSADNLNEKYLQFSKKKIPDEVKAQVAQALSERNAKGKGGSSAALNMAKFLVSNEYIDYARLNCIKDYFNRSVTSNSLSFALYGGEASKKWLNEERNDKKTMKGTLSADLIRNKIYDKLREMESEGEKYTHWVAAIYDQTSQVIIEDDGHNITYLVDYKMSEDNEIELLWDTKKEVSRCFIPVEKVTEDALLFKLKEVISIDENGQLITNTHRLSSVDSAVAKKAELLLNSLEKEGEDMEDKEEEKKEEVVDNACDEEVVVDNAEKEDVAEKVEDKEEAEDKEEDKEEKEDEDFAARCKFLEDENNELKASLAMYQRKDELVNMNALIEEFSYCFKEEEKAELKNGLDKMSFAEVEKAVNEKIKEFAKENKPKEEAKADFSTGLLVDNFSYKADEKGERTLADIRKDYIK